MWRGLQRGHEWLAFILMVAAIMGGVYWLLRWLSIGGWQWWGWIVSHFK
jgi:hypothetical protein